MARILIVDDDPMICAVLSDFVVSQGHEAHEALHLAGALAKLEQARPDLVFLDVNLPDGSGLGAIAAIRGHDSAPEVIIITGEGSAAGATLAIHNGAWDYVRKPLSVESVELSLNRALQYRSRKLERKTPKILRRVGIIGKSAAINDCLELVAKAAATDAPVLITGETGTGKELFAQAIHDNSSRCDQNFVTVDCASLPPTLVESILFGHEKGTFTGADHTRNGLVAQAHEGTLFLDEVGEMPLAIQKTLLRVLQEQRYRPVGCAQEKVSRFRLVAATNRNLEEMVSEGTFRQDLLFRLQGFHCQLPPLRERAEDVIDLALAHCAKLCRYAQLPAKGFCPQFISILQQYDWPGNVRELINVITAAFAQAGKEPILYAIHLPAAIRTKVKLQELDPESCPTPAATPAPSAASGPATAPAFPPGQALPKLQEARESAIGRTENLYLNELLSQAGQDLKQAAEIAGISLSQLYRLLRKHQINP